MIALNNQQNTCYSWYKPV